MTTFPTPEDIEKVAKAIAARILGCAAYPTSPLLDEYWKRYADDATAALTAIASDWIERCAKVADAEAAKAREASRRNIAAEQVAASETVAAAIRNMGGGTL